MDSVQAIILALVQGFTEFLPISSSAHLILPSELLGWEDQGLAFDVAVHVGTLVAIVLYFRKELISLANAWCVSIVKRELSAEGRLAWLIVLATIPAGFSGLVFGDYIEGELRSTQVIATTTTVFALVLLAADRYGKRARGLPSIGWKDAVLIGLSQALALVPGTSRSGITMTAALVLGFSRDAAARFSFLLSVPLIAAAGLLKGNELVATGSDHDWLMVSVGAGVAFLSAYACIHLFLKVLEKIGFMPFVIYRLLLGCVLFFLLFA